MIYSKFVLRTGKMEFVNVLLVVLVLVQCCTVLCYDDDDDDDIDSFHQEHSSRTVNVNFEAHLVTVGVIQMLAAIACINSFCLGLLFLSCKYGCPTRFRTVRQGRVIGDSSARMMQMQPPGIGGRPVAQPAGAYGQHFEMTAPRPGFV